MFVGVGASRVRDRFEQAKHETPRILFVDEIDAVGRRRGTRFGPGNEEREQTLNQILVEMDGFDSNAGVIVVAATNRPDVLDEGLLCPGRFDRRIWFSSPMCRDVKQCSVSMPRAPVEPGCASTLDARAFRRRPGERDL